MKGIALLSGLISSFLLASEMMLPVMAQVNSDGTTNTTVNSINNNFNILNGIQKGNNLFHSFREFSIPTGGTATFNNSTDVVNIINRVTGGNISNIDGLIKANGSANLFLINPAGIVFGENARLDIGGSFLGSTAESVLFQDGFEFSAVNPQSEPLLTVSVPLGLQMGTNPGDITVKGTGHSFTSVSSNSPLAWNDTKSGLEVKEGNTLALLGGNINLEGGILTAPGGRIELGSVQSGNSSRLVNLSTNPSSWTFNYNDLQQFGDIQLKDRALVNVSGTGNAAIQIQGENLSLVEGSALISENRGDVAAGNIALNITDSIKFAGYAPNTQFFSSAIGDARGTGKGSDIEISTGELLLNGAFLAARTFTSASGGDVTLNTDETKLLGQSDLNNSIFARTIGSGNAGNLTVNTKELSMENQATLSVSVASPSTGVGGQLTVNATEQITMIGAPNGVRSTTQIAASNFSREGQAGNITINTKKLSVQNGAFISSSAFSEANGGSVTVNASESVNLMGSRIDPASGSRKGSIFSAGILVSPVVRKRFGTPDNVTGNAGDVTINTPYLRITNGGEVSVRHDDLGNAGNLRINADSILLNENGQINGNTSSGEGGNITLNLQESLLVRRNSLINSEAKGTGNGGNITIHSPIIAGFENSDIIANAVEGNGGNIDITTQGIFGLEFRNELTEDSDITASSQFGVNGTVQINNLSIDPSSGLVELPVDLSDSSQQIASGCSSNTGSSFVATGRGGIPQNPNEQVDKNHTWSDIRDLSAYRQRKNNTVEKTQISNKPAIVEANGFMRNANGEIELVALSPTPLTTKQISECSGSNT